jgi:hypothetical protein
MSLLHRWKNGTAALMAMAITTGAVAPMFLILPANAQYRIGQPSNNRYNNRDTVIRAGATIPTTSSKEKYLLAPGETAKATLKVASNLVDRAGGNILIPRDSEIIGEFVPDNRRSQKGVRFVAREIVLPSGERQRIDASSSTITRTEKVKKGADTGEILRDAGYGAGAAAVIALLTGNRKIEWTEILLGGGAGSIYSVVKGGREADLISVDTERDLTLRLDSPLTVSIRPNNY